ncbi:MAG: hypothetical protein H6899_14450 [Rhodobacter sp.]|nr:hypothetical protein [Paracoccaceae bacterium]MCB1408619.1 hypothetical protein [Paracoccaceae bacterium]MCC0081118.1 hypothetical protein [Rhodobacter sp.]
MNTQVDSADYSAAPDRAGFSLSAGGGLALAVMVGSLMWIGVFALVF